MANDLSLDRGRSACSRPCLLFLCRVPDAWGIASDVRHSVDRRVGTRSPLDHGGFATGQTQGSAHLLAHRQRSGSRARLCQSDRRHRPVFPERERSCQPGPLGGVAARLGTGRSLFPAAVAFLAVTSPGVGGDRVGTNIIAGAIWRHRDPCVVFLKSAPSGSKRRRESRAMGLPTDSAVVVLCVLSRFVWGFAARNMDRACMSSQESISLDTGCAESGCGLRRMSLRGRYSVRGRAVGCPLCGKLDGHPREAGHLAHGGVMGWPGAGDRPAAVSLNGCHGFWPLAGRDGAHGHVGQLSTLVPASDLRNDGSQRTASGVVRYRKYRSGSLPAPTAWRRQRRIVGISSTHSPGMR